MCRIGKQNVSNQDNPLSQSEFEEVQTTMGDFYTVIELAERLGVSTRTILKEIKQRRVDVYRVGRQIRIPDHQLHKIIRPAERGA